MKHGGIAEIIRTKKVPGMATAAEAWRNGLPMESCGIGRVQIDAEIKRMEMAVGHPVEWRRSKYGGGCPVVHSRKERNRVLKAMKFSDHDAGYSDHVEGGS